MSINYSVTIEKFAESHYIKKFEKKYKDSWLITLDGIKQQLKRFDEFLKTTILEEITSLYDLAIFKMEFRVAGTACSRKSSGNRCILVLNKSTGEIKVLLVYHKSFIDDKNETASWKKIIRENYSEYSFCK